ncbi:GTPase-activating protein and VPS9 domain-containing protein 1 [Homalodisca vitripennis]|nr:GTPase-activating protein and VPS9 domain-containing protein 1 [Homalodisca vitripennis]
MDNIIILSDLIDLAGHLRQERLFIFSEQVNLQELNEKVVLTSSRLAQLAWIVFQQRVNLHRLVLSRPDCSPAMCCQRADSLESTQFVDAHKVLGYQNKERNRPNTLTLSERASLQCCLNSAESKTTMPSG